MQRSRLIFPFLLALVSLSESVVGSPAWTGSWTLSDRLAQGVILQSLGDDRVLVAWFAYDQTGAQRWMIGTADVAENTLVTESLETYHLNADATQPEGALWGVVSATLDDCRTLSGHFDSEEAGQAAIDGAQLTRVAGVPCRSDLMLPEDTAMAVSGAWTIDSQPGTGWFLEELGGGRFNAYWFGYDENGNQAWLTGDGYRSGDEIAIPVMYSVSGQTFSGAGSAQLHESVAATIRVDSCDVLSLDLTPLSANGIQPDSGSLHRLTTPTGMQCREPELDAFFDGQWNLAASPPVVLEDYVNYNGRVWAFGEGGATMSYSLISDSWRAETSYPSSGEESCDEFMVHNGSLYCFASARRITHLYHLSGSGWQEVLEIPIASTNLRVSVGEEIYVSLAERFAYQVNPVTGTVRSVEPYLNEWDDRILFSNNFRRDFWHLSLIRHGDLREFEQYVYGTGETIVHTFPLYRFGAAATVVEGALWVSGGLVNQAHDFVLNDFRISSQLYSPADQLWIDGPDLPVKKAAHFALTFPGAVFVTPGIEVNADLEEVPGQHYVYVYDAQRLQNSAR